MCSLIEKPELREIQHRFPRKIKPKVHFVIQNTKFEEKENELTQKLNLSTEPSFPLLPDEPSSISLIDSSAQGRR